MEEEEEEKEKGRLSLLPLVVWVRQRKLGFQTGDGSLQSKPHPNRLDSFLGWRPELPKEQTPVGREKKRRRIRKTESKEKPTVIEISSSSDEGTNKNQSEAGKGVRRRRRMMRRRRYSDVETKTAEEKRREEEDCCILPFDPFAAGLSEKLALSAAQHQLDDLSIVAERGHVACRDYPHSRHLCAEYPFSKTSHESCCIKCYCYVCDEAAPCKFWKGPKGHCHASDRDNSWKEMRKSHRPIKPHAVKTHF